MPLIAQRFFLSRVYEPLHRSCGKTTGQPMSCASIARVHEISGLAVQKMRLNVIFAVAVGLCCLDSTALAADSQQSASLINSPQQSTPGAPAAPASSAGAIVLKSSKAGRLLEVAHPNGVRTVISYDPVGRVATMRHSFGAADVAVVSYEYDANGNRTSQSIEAQSQTWVTSYSYDSAGRQVSRALPSGTTHYGYSARDRLTSIRQGDSQSAPTVQYQYNAQGQRTSRISPSSREDYQWDGNNLAARTNAVGNVLGSYTTANGQTLASREAGVDYYYHLDALGTPIALTDSDGGVAVRYRTDVWGKRIAASNPHPNPIGFTGYVTDDETDQLYAQSRQYAPGVGRFTTVDEWSGDSVRPLSLNQYLYTYGNPSAYTDPDGRCGGAVGDQAECAYWFAAATGDTSAVDALPTVEQQYVQTAGGLLGAYRTGKNFALGALSFAKTALLGPDVPDFSHEGLLEINKTVESLISPIDSSRAGIVQTLEYADFMEPTSPIEAVAIRRRRRCGLGTSAR